MKKELILRWFLIVLFWVSMGFFISSQVKLDNFREYFKGYGDAQKENEKLMLYLPEWCKSMEELSKIPAPDIKKGEACLGGCGVDGDVGISVYLPMGYSGPKGSWSVTCEDILRNYKPSEIKR